MLLDKQGGSFRDRVTQEVIPLDRKGTLYTMKMWMRQDPIVRYEQRDPSGNYLRVGLEGAYGQYLKGENGRRLKQKIANGQWKPINDNNEKEPTEGTCIYIVVSPQLSSA